MTTTKNAWSYIPVLLLALLIAIGIASYYSVVKAELSEEQAEQLFKNLGCTNCHNGQEADEWDEIVEEIEDEWASEFATIDEAASKEVNYHGQHFDSFDDLMAEMAENVGKEPNDPDIQSLKQFFIDTFNEGKSSGGGGVSTGLIAGIVIVVVVVAVAGFALTRKK